MISKPFAIATIEVELDELLAEAVVVGVTKAPALAYFWVMIPANGARIIVSSIWTSMILIPAIA